MRVEVVDQGAAADQALVEVLAGVINSAYAVGEEGLWLEGTPRTSPAEVADMIRAGSLLAATEDGRVAGCARVQPLDADTADLGLISVPPEQWRGGVGRELVRTAEELMRARGARTAQLELLVPQGWVHPQKKRLREWYLRLGYSIVRSAPVEEIIGDLGDRLAVPCEFLIFRKPLA
jgi:GNAT superfamily N-acetyltransferase